MAQSKPERPSVAEVLKLVDQLSLAEQEQLAEEMKLQWLRRKMEEAEESIDRGQIVEGAEVFRQLRERNAEFQKKQIQ